MFTLLTAWPFVAGDFRVFSGFWRRGFRNFDHIGKHLDEYSCGV